MLPINAGSVKEVISISKKESFPFSYAYAYVAKIGVQTGCNIRISIIPRKQLCLMPADI